VIYVKPSFYTIRGRHKLFAFWLNKCVYSNMPFISLRASLHFNQSELWVVKHSSIDWANSSLTSSFQISIYEKFGIVPLDTTATTGNRIDHPIVQVKTINHPWRQSLTSCRMWFCTFVRREPWSPRWCKIPDRQIDCMERQVLIDRVLYIPRTWSGAVVLSLRV
jgi:hypothetical protein